MRYTNFGVIILVMNASLLNGCGQAQNGRKPMLKQLQDMDVTSVPEYNFKAFSGTLWKTKVKTALGDIKSYKGEQHITLLAPRSFDQTHPEFTTPPSLEKLIAELPAGTCLRIGRLMKDNGPAGLLWITASLSDGRAIYLSDYFISKNRFLWEGWSDSKEWGVEPDLLENVK